MRILKNICASVVTIAAINTFVSADVLLSQMATGKGVPTGTTSARRVDERQFSFSVQAAPDGTIYGQAILIDPEAEGARAGEPYTLEVDITCMNVIGNVAFFGGTTSRTSDLDLIDAAYFSVQDNGKEIDKISRVFFFDDDPNTIGDPQLCMGNQPGDFPIEPIESGGIEISK